MLSKILKPLLWILGILLGILIILEIVLSGPVLTRIVNVVASDYVEGELKLGKAKISLLRRFPAATLTLEDVSVKYPIETDSLETSDIHASLNRFAASVSLPALVKGIIKIPYMRMDSLLVAGKISRDTLAAGVDRLYLHKNGKAVDIDLASKAFIATREYGRIRVPMNVSGRLSMPKDSIPAIRLSDLKVDIAHIPFYGDADLRFMSGKTAVKADLGIDGCKVETILKDYASHIIPEAGMIDTDAVIDMTVHADGYYDHQTGRLPQMLAELTIPDCGITYDGLPGQTLKLGFKAEAEITGAGRLNAKITRMDANIPGLELTAVGGGKDLLGKDPNLSIDGSLNAQLDSLNSFLPDSLGIQAKGNLSALVKGNALLSQLDIYNFSSSSLTGEIQGNGIKVDMPRDTISAVLDGIKITLGPQKRVSRRDSSRVINLVGVTGKIAKADIRYTDAISLKADNFSISAKNSTDTEIVADSTHKIHPFRGTVGASHLSFRDSDGTSLRLTETSNSFNIFPKRGQPSVPMLMLTSRNKRISLRYDVNRGMLSDANFRVTASMNTFEKRRKMNAFMDSLARVYPYVPKDSLLRHHMAANKGRIRSSAAFVEDDFKNENIDISLDKGLAKYFREWDLNGKLTVGRSRVMTPLFPLRNTLNGFELSFNNDRVGIDSLSISSGESDLSATGELTGLRRALLGRRGALKLDVDIVSEKINANQLLSAYTAGANYTGDKTSQSEELEDDEFMEVIALDTAAMATAPSLIVVPGNINADIKLLAGNIKYSDLNVDLMTADLLVKDRCVRITDTQALTNMGYIDVEGFYATRSKEDIKAGFSMNFKDITAEKVINLMPAIDTLMPLLKSFGGMLDCELAATTQLDTNMNIIMPSINGIMRIGGEDLYIKDNDMFKKMAKLLVFKNKKEGHIDRMTVEGVIRDSMVEIFPFIVEMDRYMLGLSGVQNMDMSFRYHASLIKSPFLVKLGMDVYGPDFDNMKFKIGKPKYKTKDVPVFSTVIDNTKINLVESIRNVFDKGVDEAMRANRFHQAIEEHKKKIGYVQAVDQQMEELSAAEQKQLEQEKAASEIEN